MDKKPHSRDKYVSGSANVGKGKNVNTGSRPVGSGGRPSQNNQSSYNTQHQNTQYQNSQHQNQQYQNQQYQNQQYYNQNANRPVGFHTQGSGTATRAAGGSGLKRILLIVIVIAVIFFAVKSCGGSSSGLLSGLLSAGSTMDLSGWTEGISGSPDYSDTSADISVSSLARSKYVTPVGSGSDTVTIMIYMCGTDLESKHGMATSDLGEMMKANISDKVNIIVMTGGCKGWKTKGISSTVNQIYKVESGRMLTLEDNVGTSAMTNPDNLADFIKYCKTNYPANRNFLIMWDHGGGSLSGYGYDEKYPSSSSMTLTKFNAALEKADCTFDFIGFDACLMATLETALVCNQYADYMVASEEVEPGTGWYYTGWLNALSENTSVPTVSLAKTLIDTYQASCRGSQVTLSVTDLAELQGTVPDVFSKFSAATAELVENGSYAQVSSARSGSREFSSGINQIDLCDFADRVGTPEAKALVNALKGCIKYNGSTISRANGLSIYFPGGSNSSMKSAVAAYDALGMDKEYIDCIKSFASIGTAGQAAGYSASSLFSGSSVSAGASSGASSMGDLFGSFLSSAGSTSSSGSAGSAASAASLLTSLLGSTGSGSGASLDVSSIFSLLSAFSGQSVSSDMNWMDNKLVADNADYISKNLIDPARIRATQKNGQNVLSLTEKEWKMINTVELNVFVDDGEGFIDLGLDNTFEWSEYDDNDLLLDYDGTWLTIDGHVAAYYMISDTDNGDGTWTTVGRIPCLLNGEQADLHVVFDTKHPRGVLTGAQLVYDDETETQAKGDMPVVRGDSIQLICDYYTYDGEYDSSYELGDAFTVGSSVPEIANAHLNDVECSVTYRLTDIFGTHYYTPAFDYAS